MSSTISSTPPRTMKRSLLLSRMNAQTLTAMGEFILRLQFYVEQVTYLLMILLIFVAIKSLPFLILLFFPSLTRHFFPLDLPLTRKRRFMCRRDLSLYRGEVLCHALHLSTGK